MDIAALAIAIFALGFAMVVFFCYMSLRDSLEERIQNLVTENRILEQQFSRLERNNNVKQIAERVPLRDKCLCGHNAFDHTNKGCRAAVWFGRADCACAADRDTVMFTPNPLKQLS